MNPSLASLTLVVISGLCLVVYLLGFTAGENEGRSVGRDEGHQQGKKDGAVRAFAVGYDRGRRERAEEEGKEEDDEPVVTSGPNLTIAVTLAVVTVLALTILQRVK